MRASRRFYGGLASGAGAFGRARRLRALVGSPQGGVECAGKLDVQRVAGLAGADVPVERTPEQLEVADEVEDLVANELVAEPQRTGQDPFLVEDDRVVEASAPREPARAHPFDVAGESEGARRGDARRVLLGPDRHGQLLPSDDRVREVDLVGDRQAGPVGLEGEAAVSADDFDAMLEREGERGRILSL